VIRVWEWTPEAILDGPLELLALAPIVKVERTEIPDVLRRIDTRLLGEPDDSLSVRIVRTVAILLQLRYGPMTADEMVREFPQTRELDSFQKFLWNPEQTGRVNGLRSAILHLGSKKFGAPSTKAETEIKQIEDLERLEAIHLRILDVNTWEELLQPL
jgi:hypothetical protein